MGRAFLPEAGKILTLKPFFMSPFFGQRELFDQVLRLGDEEKRNPINVIDRFFGDYRLHECRHFLWTMVETCLTTDSAEFSDPEDRANLLLRYKDLEGLIEAGYLLLIRHKAGDEYDRPEGKDHPAGKGE